MPETRRLLIKLRPSSSLGLAPARRAGLRPLYPPRPSAERTFGAAGEASWYLADVEDFVEDDAATPWDAAHGRVADQLGLDASDVLFAEPDLEHSIYRADEAPEARLAAAGEDCAADPQSGKGGRALGPDDDAGERVYAWHLGDDYSQLARAREAVAFDAPRTRIAHLDTGYFPGHATTPRHVDRASEIDYVDDDGGAVDPNHGAILDNSGHGTGTLGILAGGAAPPRPDLVLGGAPEAEVVPIRVARSVVLLRTSALARAIRYAVDIGCDVATLSMGGWPSRAWADAVDDAYLRGLVFCAAAGNHFGPSPPHRIVYPARYPRVIGVTGVMANHRPYDDLDGLTMEGSFGPASAMATAMAAYTPNIPWPRIACRDTVDLDGGGTSSATPQVAAAAALWLEKHKALLPRDWRRVEAVRHALFSTADAMGDASHFGHGVLRAAAALAVAPDLTRGQSARSSHRFAFLRLITGLGIDGPTPRERMFNLEIAQRWLVDDTLQNLVADPDAPGTEISEADRRRFMEALIESPQVSGPLRLHVETRYPLAGGVTVRPDHAAFGRAPEIPDPPHRTLRVFGLDPSLGRRFETAAHGQTTLQIRWEPLNKGPIGEYLAIYDFDASGERHHGVDLDDPRLLAQDGWAPSEGNPQFHQQMVYGVAMKTIEHFERALGRPVLWRAKSQGNNPFDDSEYVGQLLVKPHALHQANAFYSPREVALLFGYFEASTETPGGALPGSRVYSCLSHDIIAHETTHAVVDGLFRRFGEPTNPDVLAFHEAFADLVALFQHFTLTGLVEREIARTRGDLETESLLGKLALQFGDALRGRGALRDAIGTVEDGVWTRAEPDPEELARRRTPHARGAILVAAVFDAFLAIYRTRSADLVRLASGGTGVLPRGEIHPDLVARLADEAKKSASHLLGICIRGLDYLPPVDVTFFEFLRAMITADFDLVPDDRFHYRVAIVEAFRRRGIHPRDAGEGSDGALRSLAVDTLRWQGSLDVRTAAGDGDPAQLATALVPVLDGLKQYADECLYLRDRRALFEKTRDHRKVLHRQLTHAFADHPGLALHFYLDPELDSFEVHELRRVLRISPDGEAHPQVIVALTQSKKVSADGMPDFIYRGGCTVIMDLRTGTLRYRIYKDMKSSARRDRIESYLRDANADPFRALCLCQGEDEPFAALHALAEEGL